MITNDEEFMLFINNKFNGDMNDAYNAFANTPEEYEEIIMYMANTRFEDDCNFINEAIGHWINAYPEFAYRVCNVFDGDNFVFNANMRIQESMRINTTKIKRNEYQDNIIKFIEMCKDKVVINPSNTLLILATSYPYIKVINYLIDNKYVKINDDRSRTCLLAMLKTNKWKISRKLIEIGCSLKDYANIDSVLEKVQDAENNSKSTAESSDYRFCKRYLTSVLKMMINDAIKKNKENPIFKPVPKYNEKGEENY